MNGGKAGIYAYPSYLACDYPIKNCKTCDTFIKCSLCDISKNTFLTSNREICSSNCFEDEAGLIFIWICKL